MKRKKNCKRILSLTFATVLMLQSTLPSYAALKDEAVLQNDGVSAESKPQAAVKDMILEDNVVWSDDFEKAETATSGNLATYWKDGKYPAGWTEFWAAAPPSTPEGSYFELVDNTVYTGKQAIHWKGTDAAARLDANIILGDWNDEGSLFDYSQDYTLQVMVKSENLASKGFLIRASIDGSDKKVNVNLGDSFFKEANSDWTLYEYPMKELLSKSNGLEKGRIKIELFADKTSGEVWIDSMKLVKAWTLKLDKKELVFNQVGATETLKASGMPENTEVQWSSSNEKVATVDAEGKVTATGAGTAEITAKTDDAHLAVCTVVVTEPETEEQFKLMRERWVERLTSNSLWDGKDTSEAYKKIIESRDEAAKAAREKLVKDSDTELFKGVNLTMDLYKEGSNSTTSTDSEQYANAAGWIESMAVAYLSEGCEYYQDEDVKNDILYAMQWFYEHVWNEQLNNQAMFGNWYHWWITIPQNVAYTVILMHDEMSPELLEAEARVLKHFNEDPQWVYKVKGAAGPMKMTGANLSETSLVSQLRGAACSDALAVGNGTKYFDKFISVVEKGKEGILADGSFIQHTNLAYTGGYGATLLGTADKLVYGVAGSDWEISSEKLDVLWNFIWDGIRPLYADGAMFDMVEGRGLARPTSSDLKTGRVILESVALLSNSAPKEWKGKLQSFVKEQALKGIEGMGGEDVYFDGRKAEAMSAIQNILQDETVKASENTGYAKVFGGMDKAVAHSDNFSLGISYASARTGRFEFGNEENKKGWHQSDGATYIYNGDSKQYADNYWNTVDAHRLAGITTDHSEFPIKNWGNYPGNGNLNGGSAVGQFATVAMNFKNYKTAENPNLQARKSWFVFDDEIVALGTGITGIDTSRTTETIVENKKINGDNDLIIDGEKQASKVNNKTKEMEDVSWAWLEENTEADAMGYYFPEGSKLNVLREERTGSWADINGSKGISDEEVTRNYLSLAVPHGENAGNKLDSFKKEAYDYVLMPGKTSEEVAAYAEDPDIQVLCNSTFVQAVADRKANAAGYIFWGDISTPVRIGEVEGTVGSITTVKDTENHTMRVGMSDVHQNKKSLTFRIYGNNLTMVQGNDKVDAKFDKYGVTLTVNTEDAMGATIEVTLGYEDLPQEQLDELSDIRERYNLSKTGNDMSDKTDKEYQAFMKQYADEAKAALEKLNWDACDGEKLFTDLELLDWKNKGSNNTDGSANLTETANRILALARAYESEGTGKDYYQNEKVREALEVCLEYLMDGFPNVLNYHDRVFGNWWDWSIGVPKALTETGLLLYDEFEKGGAFEELGVRYRNELYNMIQLLVPDVNYYWGRSSNGRAARYAATGANGSEMAMCTLYNGLIGNDPQSLLKVSDTMVNELKYVETGEGFYKDGSFKQHGNFAYNGAYGVEKLRAVTDIAVLLNNTSWECTDADPNIIYEWILNGFRPLYADGAIFDMVQGRSISRFNRTDITTGRYAMDAIVRLAGNAPEEYKDKLLSFAKTQASLGIQNDADSYYKGLKSMGAVIAVKNLINDASIPTDTENYTKIYGSMDKAVTHGDNYSLGISMFSSRMGGAESGNAENLKGWHTSDGALTLYNGDQNQFAQGFWATVDHQRLAGITTNHVTVPMEQNNIKTNDRDWVGGSTLNTENYASVGMDFKSTMSDLEAKKSWFTFGEQIVALGAGIKTAEGENVETIVENRKIDNDNTLLVNGKAVVDKNGKDTAKANWAWLSENKKGSAIGYYFPEETEVSVKRETRTEKWSDVNKNNYPEKNGSAGVYPDNVTPAYNEVTNDYASIAVNHGTNPTDASYSYVLLPGKSEKEMADYAKDNNIRILSNTDALQAASDEKLGVSGYNFFTAGESEVPNQNGIEKLVSDTSASVTMYNDGEKNIHIAVSDPTQKVEKVTLRLEGNGLSAVSKEDGVEMTADENGITMTVDVSGKNGETLSAVVYSENAEPLPVGPEPSEKFTIKANVNDEAMGKVVLDSETGVYEKGANAILTAKAEKGYTFVNWTINNKEVSKENPYIHTVEANATITANFKQEEKEGWKETVDGWEYYEDGKKVTGWKEVSKHWYYFSENGIMETGWVYVGRHWYHMDQWGAMETGWVSVGGHWYYLNDSGAMETGWVYVGGHWYHMDQWGAMETGWVYVGGYWYYLNDSGAMETGWVSVGGHWYYLNDSGAMETGWVYVGGHWYYLNDSGAMETDWVYVGGYWYYMDQWGAMQTGWVQVGNDWYYMNADGTMATNRWIGNYYVGASGKMA